MRTNQTTPLTVRNGSKFKGWITAGTAVLSFVVGSLMTARLTQMNQAKADSDHVFELMVYHTVPGKVPALESIFRDVSKLQAKYNLKVIGYWVPTEDSPWKHLRLPCRSSQPRGRGSELARASRRPGVSAFSEIRGTFD